MWYIECVCSYWHHAIGSKGASRGFNSIGVYWSMSNEEHLDLFRSYLPHPNSESCTIFFMDSLFSKKYSIKISKIFPTGSTGPQNFSSVRVHRSRFEF